MSGEKGKIFVISAPSGTGKTTIIKEVLDRVSLLQFSVSATTRKKRVGEVDGRDYFYIDKEEFESKIKSNEFIEYEDVHGNLYGTLKSHVEATIATGKSILLDLDVKGAVSIKTKYPESLLIFIEPPTMEVLIDRLKNRSTEDEEEQKRRIDRAMMEFEYKDKFDFTVENNVLETAIKEVIKIIEDIID